MWHVTFGVLSHFPAIIRQRGGNCAQPGATDKCMLAQHCWAARFPASSFGHGSIQVGFFQGLWNVYVWAKDSNSTAFHTLVNQHHLHQAVWVRSYQGLELLENPSCKRHASRRLYFIFSVNVFRSSSCGDLGVRHGSGTGACVLKGDQVPLRSVLCAWSPVQAPDHLAVHLQSRSRATSIGAYIHST